MDNNQRMNQADTMKMNPSNEDDSSARDLEDAQRTIIYNFLKLEEFRMREFTRNKRRALNHVNTLPLTKFMNFQKSASIVLQKNLKELKADCILITSDGQEIKCHKAVLIGKRYLSWN